MAIDVPRGQAILGFHRASRVVDPRRGAEKPGDLVPGPRDFAAWLSAHPHLRVTKPVPVTALGLRGVQLDMTVRSFARTVRALDRQLRAVRVSP